LAGHAEQARQGYDVEGTIVTRNESGDYELGNFGLAARTETYAVELHSSGKLKTTAWDAASRSWRSQSFQVDFAGAADSGTLLDELLRPGRRLDVTT
jgi:hypothetical protein